MTWGFIGAGNMAGAIINGILGNGLLKPGQIGVCDIDNTKTESFQMKGCAVHPGAAELTECCDYIVLAVKPQNLSQVLPEVARAMTGEKVLVSIAAGITAESIKKAVGFDCKVVLAMPNTPLLLGHGATALARVSPATEEDFAKVREVFDTAGVTGEVPPEKMTGIIPVNGSSPAFIYLFAKTITECAEKHGIQRDTAMGLFCNALIGSAHMLMESGMEPDELIRMVCSPGGSTLAAMKVFENQGFVDILREASEACVARAEELAGEACR